MNESFALGVVVVVNLLVFLFGCTITGLSYLAYRSSNGDPSFRKSTLGFGLITFGCTVEPVYQFGIKRDFSISGQELLQLQALEGAFIALGLILLFLSVTGYHSGDLDERASYRIDSDEMRGRRSKGAFGSGSDDSNRFESK